jgi:hypothetical protein
MSPDMTSIPAKVTAVEQRGDHYQVIVQIGSKYRGSLNPNSDSRNLPFGPKPVLPRTSSGLNPAIKRRAKVVVA